MLIRICFKVKGLARDEHGKPCDAGMQVCLGESAEAIPYDKLTEPFCFNENKADLLKLAVLDGIVKPEDVEIITPEEYDRDYGDDGEEGTDDDEH